MPAIYVIRKITNTINSTRKGLGSSRAQDVLLCGSLGKNCKENKPELEVSADAASASG